MTAKTFKQIVCAIKRAQATRTRVTTSDDVFEQKAIAYAKWIAARDDNFEVLDISKFITAYAKWDFVYSDSRKNSHGRPVQERRIRSVWFRISRPSKNRYGYDSPIYEKSVEVVLPNWDWQPVVIDTSEVDAIAA